MRRALLCGTGLVILAGFDLGAMAAPAPRPQHPDPSISRAWIQVVGHGLFVRVTDPRGRVESTADTGTSCIPDFGMDSIPIHDTPGVPPIHGTHILLEPEPGRYVLRVTGPEGRPVHLVTRRWRMGNCIATDSAILAARDTVTWWIEYSPAAKDGRGPCWIHIGRLDTLARAPAVPGR